MFAVRLDKQLQEQVDLLAKSRGSNRSAIVRDALVRYLEDAEDLELARGALAESRSSRSLRELRRDLGLDG